LLPEYIKMKFLTLIAVLSTLGVVLSANAPGFPRGKAPAWNGTAVVGTKFE
jgi:hypothetical protein